MTNSLLSGIAALAGWNLSMLALLAKATSRLELLLAQDNSASVRRVAA